MRLNGSYSHVTSPETKSKVVLKTTWVFTNISLTLAAAWIVSFAIIALATLEAISQTGEHKRYVQQRTWTQELREVTFSDESRLCLEHHDIRTRFYWYRKEYTLSVCIRDRHTGPAPKVMSWGAVGYAYRSFIVCADATLYNGLYISILLRPMAPSFIQSLLNAVFLEDYARPHVSYSDFPWYRKCLTSTLVNTFSRSLTNRNWLVNGCWSNSSSSHASQYCRWIATPC